MLASGIGEDVLQHRSANLSRVLITGGAGFIGTHLTDALLARGHTVEVLDLRRPEREPVGLRVSVGDLADMGQLKRVLDDLRPTCVFNLAAVARLSARPEEMIVNTEGVRNLLAWKDPDGSVPLIVHASTQLVVGPGQLATSVTDYKPYTAYGETKAVSEKILRAEPAKRWIITRPTNVWGPRHPTFAHQIWKFLARRWYFHPSGPAVIRAYGYVENVVHQMIELASASRDLAEGGTFYVGEPPMDSALWVDEFSKALSGHSARRVPRSLLWGAATLGELSRSLGGPHPIDSGRYHRMTTSYPVQMEDTLSLVGMGPVSLEEGVARTVKWLKTEHRQTFQT